MVTLAFLCEKLSYPQFLRIWPEKSFFWGGGGECSWFNFNNLGMPLGMVFKFYSGMQKGLKLKVTKFWGLIPMFAEVAGGKLVEGFKSWCGKRNYSLFRTWMRDLTWNFQMKMQILYLKYNGHEKAAQNWKTCIFVYQIYQLNLSFWPLLKHGWIHIRNFFL